MCLNRYILIALALVTLNACKGEGTRSPDERAQQIERLRELLENIDPDGKFRAQICERVLQGKDDERNKKDN